MSEGVSRASSPPPSIVGSAPERTKTKNQLKKERKEKSKSSQSQKLVEPAQIPEVATAPPVTEPVAPIVARQKKQKKKTESKFTVDEQPKSATPTSLKDDPHNDAEASHPATPIEIAEEDE